MGKKEKWRKNINIRATYQNHSVVICMSCLKVVACIVSEKTVTQIYPEKTEDGSIKGSIKTMSPILKNTLSICIPSFKVLAYVVPEKM